MGNLDPEIIVAGAGIAGLAAARILAEAGKRVLLVEARAAVGGRLMSRTLPGGLQALELGAEFVHGRPPDLLKLVAEAGLSLSEGKGTDYCATRGQVRTCPEDDAFTILAALKQYRGPDMNFAEYVRQANLPADAAAAVTSFVEGFNAADAQDISILALGQQQAAEDAIEGDRSCKVVEGYAALAEYVHTRFVSAGGMTRMQARLTSVQWEEGAVEVILADRQHGARPVAAKKLVVALPLGVLQAGAVSFSPRPPAMLARRAMAMGPVLRLVLVFKERFWSTHQRPFGDLNFLFAGEDRELPEVWWTRSLDGPAVLTAWIGGARTKEVPAPAIVDVAMTRLGSIFAMAQQELHSLLDSSHFHDWNSDPLSHGAYSYVLEGGLEDSRQWSLPLEETLYFAGEHTDTTGHWGTVHGALRSGVRAATQVLKAGDC